ncbi:PucR family transcriptional regulator [Actinomadura sp. LD22]|uniref:PucR family transcriptional regulator n=1 Tax=Actinomadura physcomitrii TaxID=2650748 RepID=A0A6I4M2U2_9ACTN|nr:PucR family transcriptional regulator [Actinomadura physcomitrii]MWA00073.1 PucR family transcriptional regulator [Actinomadura physcomitrii]
MTPTPAEAEKVSLPQTIDPPIPARILERLREELPLFAAESVEKAQQSLPQIAHALRGQGEDAHIRASDLARQVLVQLADPHTPKAQWADLCRSLGREAFRLGLSLEALEGAFRVGTRDGWVRLTRVGRQAGASGEQLCQLAELLFASIEQVCAYSVGAYRELAAQSSASLQAARKRLLDVLLSDPDAGGIEELARQAEWRLPQTVAAVALGESWHAKHQMLPALEPDVLMDLHRPDPLLLLPDPQGPGRVEMLQRGLREVRFAIGTSVPLADAASSLHMARHALSLMRRGLLRQGNHIQCTDHLASLLILSDEEIARQVARHQLGTFTELRSVERSRLRETLLVWLSSGGTYPEVADQLHVHPQTVRYRMRKLTQMFGERLRDPQWRFEMLLALHVDQMIDRSGEDAARPALSGQAAGATR